MTEEILCCEICAGAEDKALLRWHLRSADMTQCDLFLRGFVKDSLCPSIASRSDGAARADDRSLY